MTMTEIASQPATPGADDNKTVVLIMPDVVSGFDDPELLRKTLVTTSAAVRVLLYLPDTAGHLLAARLAALPVDMEILLAPGVEPPATTAFFVHALPGTISQDQIDLALALSDVVLIAPAFTEGNLFKAAKRLEKPIIVPGGPLPANPPLRNVTDGLDPDLPGWHSRGRRGFGRLEQAIIEVLAFAWMGWTRAGMAESRKKLKKCVGSAWRPSSYFAPPGWETLAPDQTAVAASSKIVACFDAMDRSASHGSYIHRDLAWVAYFGAAFAVFAAVAGYIHLFFSEDAWGVIEFVTLLIAGGVVIGARRSSLQERWTACRLGAEQLRIARMSLPLLVLPPALATAPPPGNSKSSKEVELGLIALAEVKRAVRDQGLPRLDPEFEPIDAAKWLQCIVDDQTNYHHINHHKLERAESRLRFATQALFGAAMVAVLLHFCSHIGGLLLVTAAGPAFAAALHGAGTRLGIVHRAALSLDVERELKVVQKALAKLIATPPIELEAWREVRRLAFEAATSMGRESTAWHGLVRRYRDELP